MRAYKIAVVAGDGIGPEVVASGIAIMDAAVGVAGEFAIEHVAALAGAATYLECGNDLPASSLAVCRAEGPRPRRSQARSWLISSRNNYRW